MTVEERLLLGKRYEGISPFEFKNELISLAEGKQKKSARAMLNAGRGNPNWIAATAREAFFALGQFAVDEAKLTLEAGDLAGMPSRRGVFARFEAYHASHRDHPGMDLLAKIITYGIHQLDFDPDDWLFELVDGIIGDHYPVPDRMLRYTERAVNAYLMQELCDNKPPEGEYKLFAVEGATAAMCYIFQSLLENELLARGDRIAIMVPIFPPYVEIPHLAEYHFDIVEIHASGTADDGEHTWQYPAQEIDKLRDPSIRALFLVNPSNPPSVAIDQSTMSSLIDTIKRHNPQLMIITDDVYSTFVEHFRSLMADLPYHTIGVYSYSKYFGVTGWRLGVIAIHEKNVFDDRLLQQTEPQKKRLNARYSSLTTTPEQLRFIDRMVADSRQVALNHTAGLSTPQQVQMALFSVFAMLPEGLSYRKQTREICHKRMRLLYEGLGLPLPQLPNDADYYTQFDLAKWAVTHYGQGFADYLTATYSPVDILLRLAEQSSIVLLNGGGFYGPAWSIRVSLANLSDDDYAKIGRALHAALETYVLEWREAGGTTGGS
ncbi:aspartate 4-decarboxylase [Ferroacidibacillus organovorans]|uniref:Aminotransferase n=1 Tax=Ferroacidibacillus organovorans TaxID=1765683 RepID=A0A1V4EQK1_9BACL|nr:aspartate 4-decarboxylase [Ferroacidibacillus organovorans]OPG15209.1 aspartate 4-decarboxylase [Ferroacidibacillus organovorans]